MTLYELCNRLNFGEFYGQYINGFDPTTANAEGYVQCSSPFREDKKPSFSVNIKNGLWKDFSTGEAGNVLQFIRHVERLSESKEDNQRAFDILSRYSTENISAPNRQTKPTTKQRPGPTYSQAQLYTFTANLINGKSEKATLARTYLQERKINPELWEKLKLGIVDDKFLIIPHEYDERGNTVNYKRVWFFRNGKNEKRNRKGGNAVIWPLENLKKSDNIILSEGEPDCMSLIAMGFAAVTNTGGAGTFKREWAPLFKGKNITIVYDNGKAGKAGAEKAARTILPYAATVKIVQWDVDIEGYDVGDFIKNNRSREDLERLFDDATQIFTEQEQDLAQIQSRIYRHYKDKRGEDKFRIVDRAVVDEIVSRFNIAYVESGNSKRWFLYREGYWNDVAKPVIQGLFSHWIRREDENAPLLDRITNLLKINTIIDEEKLNHRADLLNLNNCAFSLETFKPLPHNPDFFFTAKTTYDYDPSASCPKFDKAVAAYGLHDATWVKLLQECFGYSLYGRLIFQKMFWWVGRSGGNGKGTLLRTINKLLGPGLVMNNLQLKKLSERFYTLNLKGKRVGISADNDSRLYNLALLKQITGGDPQLSEVKFGDMKEFTVEANLIFSFNRTLALPENEPVEPIQRRTIWLDFDAEIKKGDSDFELKVINPELSGILNWAIKGLQRLLTNREFTKCARSEKSLTKFLKQGDIIKEFIEDCIVIEKYEPTLPGRDYIGVAFDWELYEKYQKYMEKNVGLRWQNNREYISGKTRLKRELQLRLPGTESDRIYCHNHDPKQTMGCIKGIRLKDSRDKDSNEKASELQYEIHQAEQEADDLPF